MHRVMHNSVQKWVNSMRVPNMRTTSGWDGYEVLWQLCRDLNAEGVWVERRGSMACEFVGPTVLRIKNPAHYAPIHPYRKLNPWTMLAEFPWLMAGRHDIKWLLPYLPSAGVFSDDGMTWRAGYGPRLRKWPELREGSGPVDQVQHVVEQLTRSQYTRQAIISLWDPARDVVDGSRDYPCTQTIHLMCAPDGHLDCYVHIRSNDLFWGLSGVNAPNFCLLQMLVAAMAGLEVGDYYHIADNLHAYERHRDHMERIAECAIPSPYRQDWKHPPMAPNELEHLEQAVYCVERYVQRWNADIDVAGVANFMGAPLDSYAVQWAHFMLLWQLFNDTPHRRYVEERPGNALPIRMDKALSEVQFQPWRIAACMWVVRAGGPGVGVATQHMRDTMGRDHANKFMEAMLEQDNA